MSIERLNALSIENTLKGLEMQEEAGRFAALASRHENGTAPRAIAAFNLFQTPEPIAARMAELVAAHVGPGAAILEPSAGLGRLYAALTARLDRPRITLVEQSEECAAELCGMSEDDKSARVVVGDFLTVEIMGGFDAVCMNPPFKMGRDVKHINRALELIRPGGLLVSLCYNGAKQNKHLKPLTDTWEELPAGSFKEAGTGASVILLTIIAG